MAKNKYLLRFVPTMMCNFKCDYCFVDNKIKQSSGTMFDVHKVNDWIEAMKQFSGDEIEIYMWGGEPFLLDDTFTLLHNWLSMDHIVGGCRIDTNIYFADKIASTCPSNKLKLNCSYHMKYHSLDEEFRKVKKLKELDMVGMLNFVASEYNLKHLHNDYHMTVFDLIDKFAEIDVFVNIAGDFAFTNNKKFKYYDEYMKFILQFVSPDEWKLLRGGRNEAYCDACKHFFTVNYDGSVTCCADDNIYGNFFDGIITPGMSPKKCNKQCQSLISYPWRHDNNCIPWSSLLEYVKRNSEYRKTITKKINILFD